MGGRFVFATALDTKASKRMIEESLVDIVNDDKAMPESMWWWEEENNAT